MQGREISHQFSVVYQHRVIFSDRVFDPGNPTLAEVLEPSVSGLPARVLVCVDSGLAERLPVARQVGDYFQVHGDRIALAADPLVLSGGEAAKRDSATFDRCVDALQAAGIDRHSYLLAVGGGALLDAAGFAGSVVHRGVRQVRVPSTVLAQADAGIGVKNGINHRGSKNFLGCFGPPAAVINDFSLLAGLPLPHRRQGTVEAVKVALLRDAKFFDWIEANAQRLASGDEPAMRQLIYRCAQLHLEHIATGGDPFERGSARPLDFGHWAAHRLEQLSKFSISHGQAVAVGICIDAFYATRVGLLPQAVLRRITTVLEDLGFAFSSGSAELVDGAWVERVMQGIEAFREHLGGHLSITMLGGIGRPVELHEIDKAVMRECVMRFGSAYADALGGAS
jgi:3-dehydroquinate synthase